MEIKHIDVFKKPVEKSSDGIFFLSAYKPFTTHEEAYLKIRKKENRLLHDNAVKQLPIVPKHLPHAQEWYLRKQTADYFLCLLALRKEPCLILDLGCGNGWFSAKMASKSHVDVIGVDLNLPELQQAQRLFGSERVAFCYADITEEPFLQGQFDIITLNASLQYFRSINSLFAILFKLLKPDGEIHILDTPFYELREVNAAKKRTERYYLQMGCPEMTSHYFHHTYQDLDPYNSVLINDKVVLWQRLIGIRKSPFPRVVIKK